jgi:hypothetical protein
MHAKCRRAALFAEREYSIGLMDQSALTDLPMPGIDAHRRIVRTPDIAINVIEQSIERMMRLRTAHWSLEHTTMAPRHQVYRLVEHHTGEDYYNRHSDQPFQWCVLRLLAGMNDQGNTALRLAERIFRGESLIAEIHSENIASRALFRRCGHLDSGRRVHYIDGDDADARRIGHQ